MKPRIAYIFRKSSLFFSIENIFKLISKKISEGVDFSSEEIILPYAGFNVSTIFKNGSYIKKFRADIFHITGDVHYISFFLPPKKTILTIHDCVFMYQATGIKKWILHRLLLKWPVARCKIITTISEKTKRDILRFTNCLENKIMVIPNPVNDRIVFYAKPFNEINPVFLFIGITPNKNLARVIEALKGLPGILHIIGETPLEEKKMMEENKIAYKNFINLSWEDMMIKYSEADIILFPSTFEGFGMPIIEGQKAGRPVITSDVSPMKEVAGDAACLVDPFQVSSIRTGIMKIISDKNYRDSLISKGFENIRQYEAEAVAANYRRLYKKMINDN